MHTFIHTNIQVYNTHIYTDCLSFLSLGGLSHYWRAPGGKPYAYIYIYIHTYMYLYVYIRLHNIYLYITNCLLLFSLGGLSHYWRALGGKPYAEAGLTRSYTYAYVYNTYIYIYSRPPSPSPQMDLATTGELLVANPTLEPDMTSLWHLLYIYIYTYIYIL